MAFTNGSDYHFKIIPRETIRAAILVLEVGRTPVARIRRNEQLPRFTDGVAFAQ